MIQTHKSVPENVFPTQTAKQKCLNTSPSQQQNHWSNSFWSVTTLPRAKIRKKTY